MNIFRKIALPLTIYIIATGFCQAQTSADSLSKDTFSQPSTVRQTPAANELPVFSFAPADTLHKKRIRLCAIAGGTIYAGLSVALWKAWYADYPLTHFHTFNDWGEWADMDKAGHVFSSYSWSSYSFRAARWTGMKRKSALWTAIGISTGVQATIEVMDGFSEKWGFSIGDIGFNALGTGFFAAQELLWQQQRIQFKVSGARPDYPKSPLFPLGGGQATSLEERAAQLYGTSPFHVILKDYNALTVWASGNISSFLKNKETSRFPRWLNLALGYGAGNIYGGFENKWMDGEAEFALDPAGFPRHRQFYLSPDIDFSRIPTRHRWLKVSLGLLNLLKFPAPALEVNTLGNVRFHALHW